MQNLSLHQQSAVARSQLGTGSSQVSLVNVYLCMCVCARTCACIYNLSVCVRPFMCMDPCMCMCTCVYCVFVLCSEGTSLSFYLLLICNMHTYNFCSVNTCMFSSL